MDIVKFTLLLFVVIVCCNARNVVKNRVKKQYKYLVAQRQTHNYDYNPLRNNTRTYTPYRYPDHFTYPQWQYKRIKKQRTTATPKRYNHHKLHRQYNVPRSWKAIKDTATPKPSVKFNLELILKPVMQLNFLQTYLDYLKKQEILKIKINDLKPSIDKKENITRATKKENIQIEEDSSTSIKEKKNSIDERGNYNSQKKQTTSNSTVYETEKEDLKDYMVENINSSDELPDDNTRDMFEYAAESPTAGALLV